METLTIGNKDLVNEKDGYAHYKSDVVFDGHVVVEGSLGWVEFDLGIRAKGSIVIKAGTVIKAGWGIEAGEGIKAGWGIEAGEGIKAGEGIEAGTVIKAGGGIEAGWGIKAGEGIEAGTVIKAGSGIISLRGGLRAVWVSCLRIGVGFDLTSKTLIEAEVKRGDVILGEVKPPNPLAPPEWAWHVHHEQLVEVLTEPIENRIAYIKSDKPKEEVKTRLRLLKVVKDQKALMKAIDANDPDAVDKLHKKECPECPWDGHTIFPQGRSTE